MTLCSKFHADRNPSKIGQSQVEEPHHMRVLEHSARPHGLDARTFLTGAVEPFQAHDLAVLRGDR
jgi:hypothetical protein